MFESKKFYNKCFDSWPVYRHPHSLRKNRESLLSRFFLREGGRLYTGYSIACEQAPLFGRAKRAAKPLERSRETRFTRPNRRACLKANVSKILDLKSPSKQIFFRKLSLGAPATRRDVTVCKTRCR